MQAGDFEAAAYDARSQRSAGGRTARRQAWAENDVFSEDSEADGAATVRSGLCKSAGWLLSLAPLTAVPEL